MTARYLVGDVRATLATLEPVSVDLVLTSPPFLALRSYLPADHPDKPLEIGSEATPGAYIDTLLDVVEACTPVLAPHGSIVIELGDTYSGSGGGGGDYLPGGLRENQPGFGGSAAHQREGNAAHWRQKNQQPEAWPLDKSLCLIPELFRISLVYGFNPLTGRQTPRWRARNVIRWCRPNPPVGALGDKFRPATSDMVVICRNRSRYFDLDAVRRQPGPEGGSATPGERKITGSRQDDGFPHISNNHPAGAPPLDWWNIPTEPYEGAHYATWPRQLCVIPIAAMCPHRVCRECGRPSERIVENPNAGLGANQYQAQALNPAGIRTGDRPHVAERTDLGWTDCGHGDWRPGMVLDPFAGSGTTLAVATGHGRSAIGIDLDERNAELAVNRIGPLLLEVTA